MTKSLSKHALERFNQRGFTNRFLEVFSMIHDTVFYSHGRECIRVSRKSLDDILTNKDEDSSLKNFVKQNYTKLLKTIIVLQEGIVITIKIDWGM